MSNAPAETSNFELHGITTEQIQEAAYGSQHSGTVRMNTTQSDRFEHTIPDRPSTLSPRENLPLPTHEDLDGIIENCQRGRTNKSSATKDLLESVECLTNPSQTRTRLDPYPYPWHGYGGQGMEK